MVFRQFNPKRGPTQLLAAVCWNSALRKPPFLGGKPEPSIKFSCPEIVQGQATTDTVPGSNGWIESHKCHRFPSSNIKRLPIDGDVYRALAVAVDENYPDMLARLLKHGVKPNMADSNGLKPLYWADHLQRAEMAQLLRHAGADPARKKTELLVSLPYNLGEF